MKSCFLVLAFISAVAAQAGLPQCAKDCVTKFTTGANIGGCPQIDAKCICSQQSFLSGIACCLADVCSPADQQAAVDYAVNFCSTQGVTVPNAVTCASISSTSSTASSSSAGTAGSTSSGTITSSSTATTGGTASTSSSTATSASRNVGNQGGVGSGATGIFGGLLAALAFL